MDADTTVAVACQGGGSHAAFTAGVLRTLLRREAAGGYRITGLSGTSGGALSALVAWRGLLGDGPERAAQSLADLWRDVAADSIYERLHNASVLAVARLPVEVKLSPYQFPLAWASELLATLGQAHERLGAWGPRPAFVELARLLERHVAFEGGPPPRRVRLDRPPARAVRLLVGAVDIGSGEFKAFDSAARRAPAGRPFDPGEISLEAVLASAALPTIFRAVRVEGRVYWDGLFSQNPPIKDFLSGPHAQVADEKPGEIWVVQVNPQSGEEPLSPAAIEDRRNQLAGNLSLNQEIGFIRTINKLLANPAPPGAAGAAAPGRQRAGGKPEYKPVKVYRIALDPARLGRHLDLASKLDRSRGLIDELLCHGEERARAFLADRRAGRAISESDPP